MDRLTGKYRTKRGAVPANFAIDFIFHMEDDEVATFFEVITRLADYEDTGMTPAEIFRMKTDYHRSLRLAKEAHELLMAKADDRLLVLPCAVGTPVFVHEILCQAGMRLTYANCKYGQDCDRNDFIKCPLRVVKRPFTLKMRDGLGVKFWLTPEEAEAAIPEDQRQRP